MTRRIVQAIRALLDPPQSPQRALIDAACELHQLDYRLLEVMQGLKLPRDFTVMRGIRTPQTVEAHLYISVDAVRDELGGAANNLLEAVRATDAGLREEFHKRRGGVA